MVNKSNKNTLQFYLKAHLTMTASGKYFTLGWFTCRWRWKKIWNKWSVKSSMQNGDTKYEYKQIGMNKWLVSLTWFEYTILCRHCSLTGKRNLLIILWRVGYIFQNIPNLMLSDVWGDSFPWGLNYLSLLWKKLGVNKHFTIKI